MNKYNLSVQPYKGTKDYYPKDMYKRNYLFDIWKETALEFGYEEYDTPILEDANLYRAKSGDELGNNQLYNFTDKGGREVAIRPEMTPSLARLIAARSNELPKPIRWFNIGKYYRYEKPQRGRTREFFQLNIDILGLDTVDAEVEIFEFIDRVMNKIKAPSNSWKIFINNRKLMDYIFSNTLNLDEEMKPKVARAIDNYTKVDQAQFPDYLKELGMNEKQINDLILFLQYKKADLNNLQNEGAQELLEILNKCDALGIKNIEFKPYIMRGLAYYTSTVMELFDTGSSENPRAIFGGGRYDDLLSIFGKEKIPAFGLGWGNITMENFMETYKLFPEYTSKTQYFIPLLNQADINKTSAIAKQLRECGKRVEVQLKAINLSKQLDYASKKGIPYVIFVEDSGLQIKDMTSGKQETVTIEELKK